jgi:hypothetical protein
MRVVHMGPLSYRSPKSEIGQSPIHGRGLFAKTVIARGEMVLVQGAGTLCNHLTLWHEITPSLGPVQIQIGTISGDQQRPTRTN